MTGHEDILKCLGKELAELRQERGWSQTQAVDRLRSRHGVTIHYRTLGSYELASRAVPVATLISLCILYEIPTPVLMASAIRRAGIEYRRPPYRGPS